VGHGEGGWEQFIILLRTNRQGGEEVYERGRDREESKGEGRATELNR